jgi:hypothetical protein
MSKDATGISLPPQRKDRDLFEVLIAFSVAAALRVDRQSRPKQG